ncbi:MAG: TraR/DksA C4-type zinc finger protein [Neptuniibacter sp.]
MTDIVDNAKKLELKQRQVALKNALSHREPEQDIRDGKAFCISCGIEIPAARLAVKPNAARCIHCQQIEEQKHGR